MKIKNIATTLLLMASAIHHGSANESDTSFTVFCTGNHDSTGSCIEPDESSGDKKLDCIMVPGNIIDCKNDTDDNIECILIAATSAQAEFSCRKRSANESEFEPAATIPVQNAPSEINNPENPFNDIYEENFNDIESNPFGDPFGK